MTAKRRHFVYMPTNKSGTLYVGVTRDLANRMTQHRMRAVPGFTAKYNLRRLIWWEEWDGLNEARGRERQIKGWRREKKLTLIATENPEFRDLAQEIG